MAVMSSDGLIEIGFCNPRRRPQERRWRALAQLIATLSLVVSIAVTATVVSIGIFA
jgi:hypothetical protein